MLSVHGWRERKAAERGAFCRMMDPLALRGSPGGRAGWEEGRGDALGLGVAGPEPMGGGAPQKGAGGGGLRAARQLREESPSGGDREPQPGDGAPSPAGGACAVPAESRHNEASGRHYVA